VLTTLNILGAVCVLAYMVVAIDEMTGGALKRDFERRREMFRKARRHALERRKIETEMRYEAWLITEKGALSE